MSFHRLLSRARCKGSPDHAVFTGTDPNWLASI